MERHQAEEGPLNAFQGLLDTDPSLASLFGAGDRLVTSTGPADHEPFVGREFPSFFRVSKEPTSGLVKPCPINRTCRVDFETDAANDYFSRLSNPGNITIDPPTLCEHSRLWNGRFETRFRVPWDAQPLDITNVTVTVSDIQRDSVNSPFVCTFALQAQPEATNVPAPGGPSGPRGPKPSGSHTGVALTFPEHQEISRDEWDSYEFDKYTALRIMHAPNGGYDFLVNVDNTFLLTEISRSKQDDKPLAKYWFVYGLILAALAMLKHSQRLEADAGHATGGGYAGGPLDDDTGDLEGVAKSCDGLAQAIVPIIRALSRAPGI
jgi:hypothetical protein